MIDSKPALRLWGVPELVSNNVEVFGSERRYQLLAWLAVRAGQWMARDQAAALLWPEHEPADARRNLRKVLLDARAVPGVAGLESTDLALRWSVDTDLGQFDALLRTGPSKRAAAVALRRGALLDAMDLPSNAAWTEWLQAQRTHWDARWQSAAHEQLKAAAENVARGNLGQRLLALDPLDDEAMAAWIESCVAQGAVAAARQAWRVYADRLAQELGIEPPARLRALLDAAQPTDPASTAVQPASGRSAAPTAPTPAGDFIGRRCEIADLTALTLRPDVRLVTLLGPGGVGKSRLAMEALPVLGEALGGPTLAVAMHDLDSVREVATRLAQQLGIGLNESRDAVAQLAAKLGSATGSPSRLLLLDNGEHLADLGAWVGQLADAAPWLKLLVTSRARLNVRGEHVLPLQGLMLPDEDSRDIEAAPSFDAVRLFATRAAAALPGFSLSQHLPAVIEIVQQCAGWPLAIELAAAWVRLLPPEEIARELRRSVDVLERDPGSQQLPSRPEHASMRAVLQQSFRLLAPREREALEALTVFRGRFTRAAAQAVTLVAIPLLASLVDKSLLEADGSGQFGLHPLVAAKGQQRLQQDTARAAALGERHAEYFLRALAKANSIMNADTSEADALIDAHEADLRRAWHHALELRRSDLVASALPEWSSFFQRRGRLREGAALLQPALQWPADGPEGDLVQGRARAAVARLWFMAQEPLATVHALAEAGLGYARRAADAQAQGACLAVRASCDSELGRFDLAREGFEQALALAEAQGHVGMAIRCLRNLGSVSTRAGDYTTALTYTRRAQMRAREAGHTHAEVDALMAQAGPLLESADWSGAEQVLRQALQLAAPLGARQMLLNGRCMRGCALIELGRLAEAEDELKQVMRDAGELGQPHLQIYADTYMALAAARAGRLDDAEQALRGVAVRASEAGWIKEAMRALLFQGEVLARRGDRLGAATAWRAVAAEALIPAGERDTARRWLAELALNADEAARAEATMPDARQALRTHLLRPSAD